MWKKHGRYFPIFDNNPKSLYNITKKSCEAERNFSKLTLIKQKLRSTVPEKRRNYLSILSTKIILTKLLSYEEGIKNHEQKNIGKNIIDVCQAVS